MSTSTLQLIYSPFVLVRTIYHFVLRVFVCEPLFKAYCTSYGRNLHTGAFLHRVQGRGEIVLGNDVVIDGKCDFTFIPLYAGVPRFEMGNFSYLGHGSTIITAKRISVGRNCRIGEGVHIFDTPGHPLNAGARRAGLPPLPEDVREVVIGDSVSIGAGAIIYPGVHVGHGSIIASGAVVMADVPEHTLVGGNPATPIEAS